LAFTAVLVGLAAAFAAGLAALAGAFAAALVMAFAGALTAALAGAAFEVVFVFGTKNDSLNDLFSAEQLSQKIGCCVVKFRTGSIVHKALLVNDINFTQRCKTPLKTL
jgi:hypothetical protein